MKLRLLVLALFLVACVPTSNMQNTNNGKDTDYIGSGLARYHDSENKVLCYWTANSLQCIPDWQLKPPAGK